MSMPSNQSVSVPHFVQEWMVDLVSRYDPSFASLDKLKQTFFNRFPTPPSSIEPIKIWMKSITTSMQRGHHNINNNNNNNNNTNNNYHHHNNNNNNNNNNGHHPNHQHPVSLTTQSLESVLNSIDNVLKAAKINGVTAPIINLNFVDKMEVHHQTVNVQQVKNQTVINQYNYIGRRVFYPVYVICRHPGHTNSDKRLFKPIETKSGSIKCFYFQRHGRSIDHKNKPYSYFCSDCFYELGDDRSYLHDPDEPDQIDPEFLKHLAFIHRKRAPPQTQQPVIKDAFL